jgi:hypothetical protein
MASVIFGMVARLDANKVTLLTLHFAKQKPGLELDNCILTFSLELRNVSMWREPRRVTIKPVLNMFDARIANIAEVGTKSR